MPLRTILSLTLLLAASVAHAEDGFFDKLFGSAENTPPNPFASNYASAPPTREEARRSRERNGEGYARSGPSDPVPPGRIAR